MILSTRTLRLLVVAICWSTIHTLTFALPSGFVYLEDIDASIIQDIKFGTADNIVGRPLPGPRCMYTDQGSGTCAKASTNRFAKVRPIFNSLSSVPTKTEWKVFKSLESK